ncbi:MAG: AAA family ATPase [Alphaproteobacteria bacterium]|nr:AAA family ATPase [Alphaproteobacteria bacterium]
MRPKKIAEVIGQPHLLGPSGQITGIMKSGRLPSIVLWGPPGVGKTTVARILANELGDAILELSAVFSGVAELRRAFDWSRKVHRAGQRAVLFVDEIHRFNRLQQDAFLPVLENGEATLIGATTENPSFELNAALLSRVEVLTLNALTSDELLELAYRAATRLSTCVSFEEGAVKLVASFSGGDGRYLLTLMEDLAGQGGLVTEEVARTRLARRHARHDKSGDAHYDLASALQKAIRGSDVDAALYWAARMLNAGESPRFLLRRLVVAATEDIGNADPAALPLAISARDAFEFLGRPDGDIAIGQLVAYLAAAPKSNRAHLAFKNAKAFAAETEHAPPPLHAVNAPTTLMKASGRAQQYKFDHDYKDSFAGQSFFPEELGRRVFYEPLATDGEAAIWARMKKWNCLRAREEDGAES